MCGGGVACSARLPYTCFFSPTMEAIIDKTLSSLTSASKINDLKFCFKVFLEGLKDLSLDNDALKKELKEKNKQIAELEKNHLQIMEEKVDLIDSIETNAAAIKKLKELKIENLEEKLAETDKSKKKLVEKISLLEEKLDATEAYERRDTVILSGAIPSVSPNENIRQVTVDLIKAKYRSLDISPNDISVCHRLQTKSPANGTVKPPNIYVKFVRRDSKRDLIKASKEQARDAQNKVFANESLTPKRTAILQALLKIKRSNTTIRGVTSIEGQVYAFTASTNRQATPNDGSTRRTRDQRHAINTEQQLKTFCDNFLRQPLEDLVDSWPPARED